MLFCLAVIVIDLLAGDWLRLVLFMLGSVSAMAIVSGFGCGVCRVRFLLCDWKLLFHFLMYLMKLAET